MIGTKITMLYRPTTGMDFAITPDTWGTYVGAFMGAFPAVSYGIGAVTDYMPQAMPTSMYFDFVNTSDSSELLLRVTSVWDVRTASPTSDDFNVFLAAVTAGASDSTTVATIADFDTGGTMEFVKATVNMWSDEETPP